MLGRVAHILIKTQSAGTLKEQQNSVAPQKASAHCSANEGNQRD